MRNLSVYIFAMLVTIVSPFAQAVRVHSIYQAKVPVASQSVQNRTQAAQAGLEQVLVKVSGNGELLENKPDLKANLAHADTWMQEYSYSSPANSPKATPYLLTMRFDPEAVNRLLREAGSPIWGQNRPLILVWMVLEGPNHPADIIDSATNDDIQSILMRDAAQRGLPIIFPVMDVTDLAQISVSDVITQAIPKLQDAAKRYRSDALLIGHVTQSDSGFSSRWQLIASSVQTNWDISGNNLQQVFSSVTNNVADVLAKHYAMVTTDAVQTQLTLKVMGIKQQADLMQLMKYIQRLTPVADVQLNSVMNDAILLDVSLRGSKQSFIQSVSLGKTMEPVQGANAESDVLVYRWNQ